MCRRHFLWPAPATSVRMPYDFGTEFRAPHIVRHPYHFQDHRTSILRWPCESHTSPVRCVQIVRVSHGSRPTAVRRPRFPCGPRAAPSRPCFLGPPSIYMLSSLSSVCCRSVYNFCDSDFLHGRRAIDLWSYGCRRGAARTPCGVRRIILRYPCGLHTGASRLESRKLQRAPRGHRRICDCYTRMPQTPSRNLRNPP